MFVQVIFNLVYVAEWPAFEKELVTRLIKHVSSLSILDICNFSYFSFGFEGGIRVLIAPCFLVTFSPYAIGYCKQGQSGWSVGKYI